jgi:endonuclease/exonuclease/phosphatase family metal-dependent hydrolase
MYSYSTWFAETLDPNCESTTTPAGKLRVVTFNVLTDISPTYRIDDLILSHLRWPAILNILKDTDADVIALQEVSASFHKLLMAEPWVRKSYVVSDPFGKTLEPMGNLLLSRIPMRKVEERSYQSQDHGIVKSAVIAETMVNGRRLALAVVHLKAGTAVRILFVNTFDVSLTIICRFSLRIEGRLSWKRRSRC